MKKTITNSVNFMFTVVFLLMSTLSFAQKSDVELEKMRKEIKTKGYDFEIGKNSATERSLDQLCGFLPPE